MDCHENKLTTLNLSGLTELKSVTCFDNELTSINLTGLARLGNLQCNNNKLTALNLTGLTALVSINCSYNNMAGAYAVTGFTGTWDGMDFIFAPQNASGGTGYTVNIPNGQYNTGNAYGNSNNGGVNPDYTHTDGNTLNINDGGTVTVSAFGASVSPNSGPASTTGNAVKVGGGGTVQNLAVGAQATSMDGAATASGNSVNVTAGGTVGVGVTGGSAQANAVSGNEAAAANNNTVIISGTVGTGGIFGGKTNGGFGGNATASNNTVIISGGSVNGDVYGGYVSSNSVAYARDNSVTISGRPVISGTLYGGAFDALGSANTTDVFTGNRLNMYADGTTVAGVENFQYIDFYLPQTITDGETMLTSTAAADLAGVTIDVKFATTAPALTHGVSIRLIDGVSGTFTDKNVTVSGYTFALSVSGGDLMATVTAVHTHSYGIAWQSDSTNHWHECSCGDKTDIAAHTENGGVVTLRPTGSTTGTRAYSCTVCGRILRTENIPATGGGGGGNSGSSRGGRGGSATIFSTSVPGGAISTTPATSTGTTSVTVTVSDLNAAIDNAIKSAGDSGNAAVAIRFTAPASSSVTQVTLPKAGIDSLINNGIDTLIISDGKTTLTLDQAALEAIGSKATGDIVVSISQVSESKLTDKQKEAVNGRPVFDLSITSGSTIITDFGGGTVSVTVPYTLANGENPNAVVVYYLDADGELQIIENGVYDPVTKTISFSTNHFSLYVIGYNLVSFTDVPKSYWGRDYIEKAAARGLISGVGNGLYQPDRSVTRAEFVQIVDNVQGLRAAKAGTAEYSDVKSGAWYYDAVMNAKSAGLLDKFTGEFKPGQPITREEMSAVIAAVLKQKGVVTGTYAINLGNTYTDYDKMSEEYLDDIMAVTVSKLLKVSAAADSIRKV